MANYTYLTSIILIILPLFVNSFPKILKANKDYSTIQLQDHKKYGQIDWVKLGSEVGTGFFEKIFSPNWVLLKGKDESRDLIYHQKIADRTVYKISGYFAATSKQVTRAIKFLEENQKALAPIANAKIVKMECSLGPVRTVEFLFMNDLNKSVEEPTENNEMIIGSGGITVYPYGRNETKFDMLFDLELEEWGGLNPLVLTATLLPDFMRSILFAQQVEHFKPQTYE